MGVGGGSAGGLLLPFELLIGNVCVRRLKWGFAVSIFFLPLLWVKWRDIACIVWVYIYTAGFQCREWPNRVNTRLKYP